jgi:Mg2+ and Co2+ transporter CorA
MVKMLLLCAALLAAVAQLHAAAIPIALPAKVPDEFKDFLPNEVTAFYNELTEAEKNILKEIAANHAKYETEEQALEELKGKSEKLYNKAVELRQLLKEKLDALNPAAKAFIDGLVEEVKKLKPKGEEKPNLVEIRKKAAEVIEKYKALPEDAKESLKSNFPKITGVIQNEKFQKLAQGLLKTEGGAAGAAAPAA